MHQSESLVVELATASPVEVSVVMPCLDEARTVGRCVEKALACMARIGVRGEVVVADNGSIDGSREVALAHGARVIRVARKGYGSALQGGIAAAHGHFVIMGDSDDSYDFDLLDPFLVRLRAGDDLVMGNRFMGGIRPGAMPWLHRYVGNPILTGILNLLFRTPAGDAHCGMRGFRKDAYDRLALATPGMEFASEMVVKAALMGLRISEVPTVLHPDGRDRPPHLRSFRDGWRHLRFLLLMSPRWLFLIPAAFLLTLGAGSAAVGAFAPAWGLCLLLFAGLCIAGGHQAFWLWTFARLVGRAAGPGGPPVLSLDRLSLEYGLAGSGTALLAGLGVTAWALSVLGADGPPLATAELTRLLCGGFLMLLGVQAAFNSLFMGVLRLGAGLRPDGPPPHRLPE